MDIEGYGEDYKIYSDGRVVSVKFKNPRVLSHVYRGGSPAVNLCKRGTGKLCPVARLVALSYVPKVEGKNYVGYKDQDKGNVDASNLEWVGHHMKKR